MSGDQGLRRALYKRVAPRYDLYAASHRNIARALVGFSRPHIAPGARCADIACGTGAVASELAPYVSLPPICCDAAPLMCLRCQEKHGFPAIAADMAALPFADRAFDAAFCSMALHWAEDPAQALAEMRRIAPMAALAVPIEGSLAALHTALQKASPYLRLFRFAPHDAMARAAETAGWRVNAQKIAQEPLIYASAQDALAMLRGWGGNNPPQPSKPRYPGRAALARLRENMAVNDAWRVWYAVLEG